MRYLNVSFLSSFWYKYNVVFAIPLGMTQTLIISYRLFSLFLVEFRRIVETDLWVKPA